MKLNHLIHFFAILVLVSCLDKKNEEKNDSSPLKTYHSDSLHISFNYPKNWEIQTYQDKFGIYEGLEESSDDFQENIIIWTEDMPMVISDSLYAKAATAELIIKNPLLNIQRLPKKQIGENIFHPFEFEFRNADSSDYYIFGYTMVKGKRGYNFSCTASKSKAQKHQAKFEAILKTFKPL